MFETGSFTHLPENKARPQSAWDWVELFLEGATESPAGVLGHAYFDAAAGKRLRQQHLVISFAVHGNEWGTLPAAVDLLWGLKSGEIVCNGPISLLLGNLDAIKRDVRFVEEDYNRVFTFDGKRESLERRRAEHVRPILDEADFFFDLHQTQTKTESAFWTFPYTSQLADWARVIAAAPRALVRAPGGAFSQGQRCLDEYVRLQDKVGITVELGEKGADLRQAAAAYGAVVRLIEAYDLVCTGERTLRELADNAPELNWYETVEVIAPPSADARLKQGLNCFTQVEQGEVLSAPDSPLIIASQSGYVLFPKYPAADQPAPPELLRLAVPVHDPQLRYQLR